MAAKKTLRIDGVKFQLYEQSIKVDGFASVFWFKRPVTADDAFALSRQLKEEKGEKERKEQEMAKDVMLEHERMRFRTMDKRQLYARLSKITKMEKLAYFITVARSMGYMDLVTAAIARQRQIREAVVAKALSQPAGKPEIKRSVRPEAKAVGVNKPVKASPAPIKEEKLTRALDF